MRERIEVVELPSDSDSANAYYDAGMGPVGNPVNSAAGLGLFAIINKDARNLIFNQLSHNDLLSMRRATHAFKSTIDETKITLLDASFSYEVMFSLFQRGSLEKLQDEIIATEEAQEDYQDAMGTYIDADNDYQRKTERRDGITACCHCGNAIATCGCLPSSIAWCVLVGKDSASATSIAAAGYSALGFLGCCIPTLIVAISSAVICYPKKPTRPREDDFQPDLNAISNSKLHAAQSLRDLAHHQRGNKPGR